MITIFSLVGPARGAVLFAYESTLILDGGAGGRVQPTHVSCDPVSGEICVTDARQSALHVLSARHVPLVRTGPFAGISWPASGSVDRDGTLVFTDTGDARTFVMRRLDIYGEPAPFAPESPLDGWSPRLVTVLADGDYLSLDQANAVLARHERDSGRLVWWLRVGDPQARDTLLDRPAEGPDGTIYVPGGDQRRVFVVTAEGRPAGAFGEFGSAPGRMVLPVGVACGPGGTILVLDRMRAKILVFGPDHRFQSEFGSLGARPGQFYHPAAIAATPDNKICVAQGFLGRVQVFRVFTAEGGDAERSAGSAAAQGEARIALRGNAAGRAATQPADARAERGASVPQIAVVPAADQSPNPEAEL
ncbi:MAG: NHL repeat-containing protein [Candidatus Krumholzibacteriia bacterium]